MLRITLVGATGRMGKMIRTVVGEDPDVCINHLCVYGDHKDIDQIQEPEGLPLESFDAKACMDTDVVIDFSLPETFLHNLHLASKCLCPILFGMTGLARNQHQEMINSGMYIPVFWMPNSSFGVAVLRHLIFEAARLLPAEYDIEIVETHHRYKIDSPSGTALAMGKSAAMGRRLDHDQVAVMNRNALTEARKENTIGYATVRGGGIVGDHSLTLTNDYEQISLGHRSLDRRLFALGSLRAAKWLAQQPAGVYEMDDMVKGFLRVSAQEPAVYAI